MELRAFYDSEMKDASVLSEGTGKIWYEKLVGGLRYLSPEVLREKEGSVFGFDMDSFVIDVPVYLSWCVFIPAALDNT